MFKTIFYTLLYIISCVLIVFGAFIFAPTNVTNMLVGLYLLIIGFGIQILLTYKEIGDIKQQLEKIQNKCE